MNMNGGKKSDRIIVPKKVPNKEDSFSAEAVEGRVRPKRKTGLEAAVRTQSRVPASIGLAGVRRKAMSSKRTQFTALMHHLTLDLLKESYEKLNRHSASGIDGLTWGKYGEDLDDRLSKLHDQIHKGSYRCHPVKRSYIPKSDGSKRPLSIWCIEDKIVQYALSTILGAIYEADFQGFSYGFRPNRNPHNALDALAVGMYRRKINWILDVDIEKFFDRMDHTLLLKFIGHRIKDKRVIRLIRKWLNVRVFEDGKLVKNSSGAPQGGVISPILSNVYLHYTLDLWVKQWRKNRVEKDMIIIRYADDCVFGFQSQAEAETFLSALVSRLSCFRLKLHPQKTRLIRFGKYAIDNCLQKGGKRPETFDFLGFTHYCMKSHKTGNFVLGRKSIKSRMRSQLLEVKRELRRRLHAPIENVGKWLNRVLTGHLNYYAVPGNSKSISQFFYRVRWYWFRSLRRRSQRNRMNWERYNKIAANFLPRARVIHPQPWERFDVITQGRSPVR